MALADYFDRAAVAISQAIAGFDPDAFREILAHTSVGISFGREAAESAEGRALLDMTVALAARLYPTIVLPDNAPKVVREGLAARALAINPRIHVASGDPTISLIVGPDAPIMPHPVFVGSNGWWAHVSNQRPQPIGTSDNPIGAGAAACLGVGNVFRSVFVPGKDLADRDLHLSIARLISGGAAEPSLTGLVDDGKTAVAGIGAIGNAVVWCLCRMPVRGHVQLVDHQCLDLGNLQRYVLTVRDAVGRRKVAIGEEQFKGAMTASGHAQTWGEFVATQGYKWDRVLVGLDTPRDRRLLQGSLPRWIANGWTQIGELGLSTHVLDDADAPCLACLYLTRGSAMNEDEQVARALGLRIDLGHLMIVRDCLYRGTPGPEALLREIAQAKAVDWFVLEPYVTRPLRDLYVEGICGGGIVRLGSQGPTAKDLQVPLAHQSALAGVLVAGAYSLDLAGVSRDHSQLVRINPSKRFSSEPNQPFAKDDRGLCLCVNADALAAYGAKYRPVGPVA